MNRLGELGISLSLDDFGTGSSSLAYLRDAARPGARRSTSPSSSAWTRIARTATIVETIVDLAHNLGLRAVGEGIETEEAYRLLAASGCDPARCFLMGRPMPANELTALARREHRQPTSRRPASPPSEARRG